MKPKHILSALTALWVAFVTLEGVSSIFRLLYSRKMHAAVRAVYGLVNAVKMVFIVILAVSNAILFIRHVDDGDDGDDDGDDEDDL